jgi:hypothetical protein
MYSYIYSGYNVHIYDLLYISDLLFIKLTNDFNEYFMNFVSFELMKHLVSYDHVSTKYRMKTTFKMWLEH